MWSDLSWAFRAANIEFRDVNKERLEIKVAEGDEAGWQALVQRLNAVHENAFLLVQSGHDDFSWSLSFTRRDDRSQFEKDCSILMQAVLHAEYLLPAPNADLPQYHVTLGVVDDLNAALADYAEPSLLVTVPADIEVKTLTSAMRWFYYNKPKINLLLQLPASVTGNREAMRAIRRFSYQPIFDTSLLESVDQLYLDWFGAESFRALPATKTMPAALTIRPKGDACASGCGGCGLSCG